MAKKVSVMAVWVMLDVDGVAETATGQPSGALLLVDDTMPNIAAARSAGWDAVHWDGSERLQSILDRRIRHR